MTTTDGATPLRAYQLLATASVVAIVFLIGVGSTVRTTGSGLGCPDWPLCHGRLLPPAERTAIIEWSHRTTAAVTGAMIVAVAAWTIVAFRRSRLRVTVAAISLPLLAAQALLGREAVVRELPPEIVAFHMLTAFALLAMVTLLATVAGMPRAGSTVDEWAPVALRWDVLIVAVATGLVLAVGAYTLATGGGYACSAWPGCPEAPLPWLDGGRLQHIQWLHRASVLLAAAAIVGLLLRTRQTRASHPLAARVATLVAVLYVAQVVLGAINIWSDFEEVVRVAHLVTASAIWALAVALVVLVHHRPSRAG